MALQSAFDELWPLYRTDLGFDDALLARASSIGSCSVQDVEGLLLAAIERSDASMNVRGVSAAALLLEALPAELNMCEVVAEVLTRLRKPEVFEDLKLDLPRLQDDLSEVETVLSLNGKTRRLRVLVVRDGFSPDTPTARALHEVAEVRIPGSSYVAETGNEDEQGRGEHEVVESLRSHLQSRPVDLVVAQSRGCRLVAEHLVGGTSPCWAGPVLALSPAGQWGRVLMESPASAVLVAASGNDVIELSGHHAVLELADIEELRQTVSNKNGRSLVFDEQRHQLDWGETIGKLLHEAIMLDILLMFPP